MSTREKSLIARAPFTGDIKYSYSTIYSLRYYSPIVAHIFIYNKIE